MSEAHTWEEELLAPSVLQRTESILIYVICKAMQYIRCNSFFDHCTDQPDKGYMWLLSYLRRECTGTRLSVWLCHFLLLFSVQFHLLVNLSVISIPQSHFRLQPWETCEMGVGVPPNGTKCKTCFRIFEWFFTCSPESLGHCLLLQSPRSTRPVNCDQGWQTRGH